MKSIGCHQIKKEIMRIWRFGRSTARVLVHGRYSDITISVKTHKLCINIFFLKFKIHKREILSWWCIYKIIKMKMSS